MASGIAHEPLEPRRQILRRAEGSHGERVGTAEEPRGDLALARLEDLGEAIGVPERGEGAGEKERRDGRKDVSQPSPAAPLARGSAAPPSDDAHEPSW